MERTFFQDTPDSTRNFVHGHFPGYELSIKKLYVLRDLLICSHRLVPEVLDRAHEVCDLSCHARDLDNAPRGHAHVEPRPGEGARRVGRRAVVDLVEVVPRTPLVGRTARVALCKENEGKKE